jgi:hypothetical protein
VHRILDNASLLVQRAVASSGLLSSRPEVIAAKRRITELQAELVSEQSKLKALVELGTPFAQYQSAVLSAEGFIPGFIQRLRKGRIDQVLLHTYGTSNQAKLDLSSKTRTDWLIIDWILLMQEVFKFEWGQIAQRAV